MIFHFIHYIFSEEARGKESWLFPIIYVFFHISDDTYKKIVHALLYL